MTFKIKLLVIGHSFPEPRTTAAGGRMIQILKLFLNRNFEISFATTATKTTYSELPEDVQEVKTITLNDSSFDSFVTALAPDVVLFDRFMTEEQFGWRVAAHCPDAVRILDTEDLHFLRQSRRDELQEGSRNTLYSDLAKRELAAIFRSDLSLIISEVEMELLRQRFAIPESILFYLPFLLKANRDVPGFEGRRNFMTIGNLKHAPNVDAVLQLNEIWPNIRKKLPDAQCHIFGAYAPKHITTLHKPTKGFHMNGWVKDVKKMMEIYRVQLAPIRFGAGIKGKVTDAFSNGLPTITTEVGAEGIAGNLKFGGEIAPIEDFAEKAVQLYTRSDLWREAQNNGYAIIENRFCKNDFDEPFFQLLEAVSNNLIEHRNNNFFGQILNHHSMQSTKYLSKWIEEKNRNLEEQ